MRSNAQLKLLVYGTLRRGYGNHRILERADYGGTFFVKHHMMWTMSGGFPYVSYSSCRNITVELFNVTNKEFSRCDRLEGYPTHYQRKLIPYFKSLDDRTPEGEAWMYYVADEPSFSHDEIPSGDWNVFTKERQEREAKRQKYVPEPNKTSNKTTTYGITKATGGYYRHDKAKGIYEWVAYGSARDKELTNRNINQGV